VWGKGLQISQGHRSGKVDFTFGSQFSVPYPETIYIDGSGKISIGNGVSIHRNVTIFTHEHCHDRNVPIVESKGTISDLEIGDDVFIGANVTILASVNKISTGAVIGAGSVLTKDVGEYEIWAGNPAKFIKNRP
jgi:acetyltransferase-like isoleucine patch superfamily enzyme